MAQVTVVAEKKSGQAKLIIAVFAFGAVPVFSSVMCACLLYC